MHPDWHDDDDAKGVIKVIMTASSDDAADFQRHRRNKRGLKDMAKRFRDPDDALRLVIVCDMWLTGFDAPCAHTMYIDKPMKGHGLMQAIARVNRVWRDKPSGLVVDYLGVAEQLKQAVQVYSGRGDAPPGVPIEQAMTLLEECMDVVAGMFHGFDISGYHATAPEPRLRTLTGGVNHIIGLKDGKPRYLGAMSRLNKALAIAQHLEDAKRFRSDAMFYQAVEQNLRKYTVTGAGADIDQVNVAIRQLIASAVESRGVIDIFGEVGMAKPELSILSDEFLHGLKNSEHKNLGVEVLQKLLIDELTLMKHKNLVQARRFSEMLERTIIRYQNRTIESAQVILELIDMAKEVRDSPKRGDALGLTADELAFYDALLDHGGVREVMSDDVLGEIARALVERIRTSVTIDWKQKESVRAKMRTKIKRLLRKHGYPPDKRKAAVDTIIEQAEEVCKDWA